MIPCRSLARAACLALLALAPGPAGAQDADATAEPAIGRVNQAGHGARRACTGTLIAPDLVLTAAHCTEGGPAGSGDLLFVAGWDRGASAGHAPAASVARHPGWRPGGSLPAALGTDMALLRLARPIPGVTPLRLGPPPRAGETLSFRGYPETRPHMAVRVSPCLVSAADGRAALLACTADRGQSGSPVLRMTDTGPEIAAILVATRPGSSVAAIPGRWAEERLLP